MEITTTDANSNSEEESHEFGKKRWLLKSGKLRMADSMVMHKGMCLHVLVYIMVHYELSIALFVSNYLQLAVITGMLRHYYCFYRKYF